MFAASQIRVAAVSRTLVAPTPASLAPFVLIPASPVPAFLVPVVRGQAPAVAPWLAAAVAVLRIVSVHFEARPVQRLAVAQVEEQ